MSVADSESVERSGGGADAGGTDVGRGDERRARLSIASRSGTLEIDTSIGNLRELAFVHGGRRLAPLHTAPWADDDDDTFGTDADAVPPVERRLGGDFFCAPFGANDVEGGPPHGWPANSAWNASECTGSRLRLTLARRVMGATIEKSLELVDDAPLLYQTHVLEGGSGGLTVAHHPMVRSAGRARLCLSPKRAILTPVQPLEPGRHRLALDARASDPTRFPAVDGDTVDLTRLPIGEDHEDFVTLVEAPGRTLGWTAVVREEEEDIVFFLKDPAVLPVTMLWHSNGGRDHAPWNGRHTGVLGIEDGCAAEVSGHRAALGGNRLTAMGVPTALPLAPGRRHRIRHVIGCVPRPSGWSRVDDIVVDDGGLRLIGDAGAPLRLPFDAAFFDEEP